MLLLNLVFVLSTSLGCAPVAAAHAPVASADGPYLICPSPSPEPIAEPGWSVPMAPAEPGWSTPPGLPPPAEPGWSTPPGLPPPAEPGWSIPPKAPPPAEPGWSLPMAPLPVGPGCSVPKAPPPAGPGCFAGPMPSTVAAGHWNFGGLVKLAALKALPAHTVAPVAGYGGGAFHLGVITSNQDWQAFAAAAGIARAPALGCSEMVVFAILDAQTNSLSPRAVSADGSSLVFNVDWRGIEPFYVDATPAAIHFVARGAFTDLTVRHAGGDIGAVLIR